MLHSLHDNKDHEYNNDECDHRAQKWPDQEILSEDGNSQARQVP